MKSLVFDKAVERPPKTEHMLFQNIHQTSIKHGAQNGEEC